MSFWGLSFRSLRAIFRTGNIVTGITQGISSTFQFFCTQYVFRAARPHQHRRLPRRTAVLSVHLQNLIHATFLQARVLRLRLFPYYLSSFVHLSGSKSCSECSQSTMLNSHTFLLSNTSAIMLLSGIFSYFARSSKIYK